MARYGEYTNNYTYKCPCGVIELVCSFGEIEPKLWETRHHRTMNLLYQTGARIELWGNHSKEFYRPMPTETDYCIFGGQVPITNWTDLEKVVLRSRINLKRAEWTTLGRRLVELILYIANSGSPIPECGFEQ